MKQIAQILAVLTIIGIVSGGALAMVAGWANPKIDANRKAETERAIFLVLPDGKTYKKVENVSFDVFEVDDANGDATGYAMIYEGNGFQGKVRLMVGIKQDLKTITAMEVLEQSETPGLGTKILEEPYKGQFNGLVAEPSVVLVKGVAPSAPNEVQAITGATISSRAVVSIVNEGLTQLRKELGGEQ